MHWRRPRHRLVRSELGHDTILDFGGHRIDLADANPGSPGLIIADRNYESERFPLNIDAIDAIPEFHMSIWTSNLPVSMILKFPADHANFTRICTLVEIMSSQSADRVTLSRSVLCDWCAVPDQFPVYRVEKRFEGRTDDIRGHADS